MSVRIVLIPVDEHDRRKYVESIEDSKFTHDEFIEFLRVLGKGSLTYSLSDFMDECNNQEIELEGFWLTYVNVTDSEK